MNGSAPYRLCPVSASIYSAASPACAGNDRSPAAISCVQTNTARPKLRTIDRIFWITIRQLWSSWADALILVKPETVVSWHRAGFRLFWRVWSSIRRPGRPKISAEIRTLIRRMRAENPRWGAPRIHGELLKLGFQISEPTRVTCAD